MSSAVFFLLLAVGLMMVGSIGLWLTHRQPPMSDDQSVDDFRRNLAALDPESFDPGDSIAPNRPDRRR